MILNIDSIIFSLQRAGGISVYWYEICNRLVIKDAYFFESVNKNIFSKKLNIARRNESFLPIGLLRYFPFTKCLTKKTLFHSSYYRVSLQRFVANITTVHDFTYEYYSSGLRKNIHTLQKNFALRHSAGVICVSENTKKDLIEFVPDIDQSRIKVIYNGVGAEFHPLNLFEGDNAFNHLMGKKFILFVGDRSPYKNFDKAVGVAKQFPELSLVVVGGKAFSAYENDMLFDLKDRYYQFTGLSGDALNWLYNLAFCLLYPSSYEGFGIPVVEAMKAGCPVISTNLSSIPEIAGDAALLVDQPTVDLLCEKLKLLECENLRQSLRQKGFVQASKFSWDKCFEETYAFYQEVWEREFGEKPLCHSFCPVSFRDKL